MKDGILLTLLFGAFAVVVWYLPGDVDLSVKVIVTGLLVLVVAIVLIKSKLYWLRKAWREIVCAFLLASYLMYAYASVPTIFLPLGLGVIVAAALSLLLARKITGGPIYKSRKVIREIAIDNRWVLNHWGSQYAIIRDGNMVFRGDNGSGQADGSHIDLNEILNLGREYEVSCLAKSIPDSSGTFQLWCHDDTGANPHGIAVSTAYRTPSTKGDMVTLPFRADNNRNIRIHLQYSPGSGEIVVSEVKISELLR